MESESCSVVSDSLWPHGLYSPWNSPGQNTGVGSLSLLQGIFPTQGSNPGLLHCRWILYQLSHELWCWRRLLRFPWTAGRSNQSVLKEINLEYPLKGLMLKLKLQYFGHLMWKARLIEKYPNAGKDRRQKEKRMAEDEMAGWHHWLNEHELDQTPGDGGGQGSLVCYSPWGHKVSDMS